MIALAPAPLAHAVSGNLITTNPGFETGDFTGWSANANWWVIPDGANHYALCQSTSAISLTSNKYNATPGHLYAFSAEVWLYDGTNAQVSITPVWTLSSGSTYAEPTVEINSNTGGLVKYTVNEIAPVNATKFQLKITCYPGSNQMTALVDNGEVKDYYPDDLEQENQDLNDNAPTQPSDEGYTPDETHTAWLNAQGSIKPQVIVGVFNDTNNNGKKVGQETTAGAGIVVKLEKCPTAGKTCSNWSGAQVFYGVTSSTGFATFDAVNDRVYRATITPTGSRVCSQNNCTKHSSIYVNQNRKRVWQGLTPTYALTANVKDNATPANNLSDATVALQMCATPYQDPTQGQCIAWGDVVDYGTTDSSGNATFTVSTYRGYRVVATKDNYWCNTPSNCLYTIYQTLTPPSPMTKNFTLQVPRTPAQGEVCPSRLRNDETQKKVSEKGIYYAAGEQKWDTYFQEYFHSWDYGSTNQPQYLPAGSPPSRIFMVFTDEHTDTSPYISSGALDLITQTAQSYPGHWWILGHEPNGHTYSPPDRDDKTGALVYTTTVSAPTFTLRVYSRNYKYEDPSTWTIPPFAVGDVVAITQNHGDNADTETYTWATITEEHTQGSDKSYWTYTASYQAGSSTATYDGGGYDDEVGLRPGNALTPQEFAEWYHAVTQAILSVDASAKFVAGYFVQPIKGTAGNPRQYFADFVTAWQDSSHSTWCAEPPMDAVHSNFVPAWNEGGDWQDAYLHGNEQSTFNYVRDWRDFIFGGGAGAMSVNERFSLGGGQWYKPDTYNQDCATDPNCKYPSQAESNQYIQAVMGRLLDPTTYSYILFVMNYDVHESSADGSDTYASHLLSQSVCDPNVVPPPQTSCGSDPQPTSYANVFANVFYGNAGWEDGTLNQWTPSDANGNYADKFSVIADPYTSTIASQYTLKFNDTASTARTYKFTSRKIPLAVAAGASITYTVDYKGMTGAVNVAATVRYYDQSGVQIGTSCVSSSFQVSGSTGWQTWQWTPTCAPPSNAAYVDTVLTIAETGSAPWEVWFDNISAIVKPQS